MFSVNKSHRSLDFELSSRGDSSVDPGSVTASMIAEWTFGSGASYLRHAATYYPAFDRFAVESEISFDHNTDGLLIRRPPGKLTNISYVRKCRGGIIRGALQDEDGTVTPCTFAARGNFLVTEQRARSAKGAKLLRSGIDRDLGVLHLAFHMMRISGHDALSRLLSACVGAECYVVPVDDKIYISVKQFGRPESEPLAYVMDSQQSLTTSLLIAAGNLHSLLPKTFVTLSNRRGRENLIDGAGLTMVLEKADEHAVRRIRAKMFDGIIFADLRAVYDVAAPSFSYVIDDVMTPFEFTQALNRPRGFSSKMLSESADVPKGVFGVHVAGFGPKRSRRRLVRQKEFLRIQTDDPSRNLLLFFVCGKGTLFWSKLLSDKEVMPGVANHSAEATRLVAWVDGHDLQAGSSKSARRRSRKMPKGNRDHDSRFEEPESPFEEKEQHESSGDEDVAFENRIRRLGGGGKRNNRRQRTFQENSFEECARDRRAREKREGVSKRA